MAVSFVTRDDCKSRAIPWPRLLAKHAGLMGADSLLTRPGVRLWGGTFPKRAHDPGSTIVNAGSESLDSWASGCVSFEPITGIIQRANPEGESMKTASSAGFAFALLCGLAFGQSTSQSVQGLVTDTSAAIVPGATVTLTTANATTGGVIEIKRIVDLPLNGRNMVNLAVLVPGVQYGIRTSTADGLGGFPIPGSGFSVIANGQREIHQFVSLDGTDAK